jgi:hypothetical protein
MIDREWQDGDDTALHDAGYSEAIEDISKAIKTAIDNPQIDIMPASMALRVLLATLSRMGDDDE